MLVIDPDAGESLLRTELLASGGHITLAGTAGLQLLTGDGQEDHDIIVIGRLSDINAALDGLQFTPEPNYTDLARITITTSDFGSSGVGVPEVLSEVIDWNFLSRHTPHAVHLSCVVWASTQDLRSWRSWWVFVGS